MNILVPTDFSDVAEVALHYAIMIGKKFNSNIIVMHAIPKHATWLGKVNPEQEEDARQKMDALRASVLHTGMAEEKVVTKVIEEYPLNNAIKDLVKEHQIQLLVMGTTGASGIKKTVVGSFTGGMIENAPVPLIAVPHQTSVKEISHIVYASDLKNLEKELDDVLFFAEAFNAAIHVLHVDIYGLYTQEKQAAVTTVIERKAKQVDIDLTVVEGKEKNLEHIIHQFVMDKQADMLAMFTRNRGFLDQLFENGYTEEISYHTKVPLFAFRK